MSEHYPISKQDMAELRRACGAFLKANGLKVGTKTAAKLIHAFWYGALVARDDTQNAYVTICLLSGRHEDLVTIEKEC